MLSKNFFRQTVKCVKSFFSKQARNLKTLRTASLCISRCCTSMHGESKRSCSFRDLDELYSNECVIKPEKATKPRNQKKGTKSKVKTQASDPNDRNADVMLGGDQGENGREKSEVRGGVVVEKLKSMKKMMEEWNSEHAMDIDETIHYYSLITSETFQDIVDKFFVDLCCEFSVSQVQPGQTQVC